MLRDEELAKMRECSLRGAQQTGSTVVASDNNAAVARLSSRRSHSPFDISSTAARDDDTPRRRDTFVSDPTTHYTYCQEKGSSY